MQELCGCTQLTHGLLSQHTLHTEVGSFVVLGWDGDVVNGWLCWKYNSPDGDVEGDGPYHYHNYLYLLLSQLAPNGICVAGQSGIVFYCYNCCNHWLVAKEDCKDYQ